jgi:hypothetical protein
MFVMYEFDVGGVMAERQLLEKAAKGRQIDSVPCAVRPAVCLLEILAEVSAVYLESEISVNVAGVSFFC